MQASGSLFVNQGGDAYEDMYCILEEGTFTGYLRIRPDVPSSVSNKNEIAVDFPVKPGFCDAKVSRLPLSALSKLRRAGNKDLPPSPYFFNVTVFHADEGDTLYKFATATEDDRARWIGIVKGIGKPQELIARGEKKEQAVPRSPEKTRSKTPKDKGSPGKRGAQNEDSNRGGGGGSKTPTKSVGFSDNTGSGGAASSFSDAPAPSTPGSPNKNNKKSVTPGPRAVMHVSVGADLPPPPKDSAKKRMKAKIGGDDDEMQDASDILALGEDNDEDEDGKKKKSGEDARFLGLKVVNFLRFMQVLAGFPFAIVIGTVLQPSASLYWMKRPWFIYACNLLLVFGVPVLLVQFVMKEYTVSWIQRVTLGGYLMGFYGIPIGLHYIRKLVQQVRTPDIVEGAFSFKPSSRVRLSFSNVLMVANFFFEWLQLVVMVLPTGLISSGSSLYLKSYPPYLDYKYYFWLSIALTYCGGIILLLVPVLRGKSLYKFTHNSIPWNITFALGHFLYLPLIVVMFMGVWCDYTDAKNPTFLQDENVACYGDEQIMYACGGLITIGFLIILYVILPPGTYKETIPESLDIIFVPNYLSVHAYLKTVFGCVYVLFYTWDVVRIPLLTFCAFVMLLMNMSMKPCSVKYINVLKDTILVHVCLTGISSLNYITFDELFDVSESSSTRQLVVSILGSNVFFSSVGMAAFYYFSWRHTETAAAANLVELDNSEQSVGHGSRILEPLISITIDNNKEDIAVARKYIPKLVGFIEHPAPRVQFQVIWALANMSLFDEASRIDIHEAQGTKKLLDQFDKFSFVVQLEALACLANLSLSTTVSEALVRRYNCVPFLMEHIGSKKPKHSLFALICLCNLSMRDMFREQIRYSYGIESIITCLMSHDYNKRKFGALALSNMALSQSKDIKNVFETRGLIDRIVKMAKRNEVETQREVVALVRNLACHAKLRPALLDSGIMGTLEHFRGSIHEDVAKWTDEISILMQREITMGNFADTKIGGSKSSTKLRSKNAALEAEVVESDKEFLRKMQPLDARVEWSTWGSKLDTIFQSLVNICPPTLTHMECAAGVNESIMVNLARCMDPGVLLQYRDSMTFVMTHLPHHGDLENVDGEEDGMLYTPNEDFQGEDTFTYVVKFGENPSNPCTIKVWVGGDIDLEAGNNSDSDDSDEDDEDESKHGGGLDKPTRDAAMRRSTFARMIGGDSSKNRPSFGATSVATGRPVSGFYSYLSGSSTPAKKPQDDYPDDEYA
jgi:hypothetical protein